MERLYPTSLAEIEAWQQVHGTTSEEARTRYVQFIILESLAGSPLHAVVTFKGGNALRFAYNNPRSTVDLDFTVGESFPDDAAEIQKLINHALRTAPHRFAIKARCQSVHRNQKRRESTFLTYEAKVTYAFPGDRLFPQFESIVRGLSRVVSLELSLNDVVCETVDVRLSDHSQSLVRVCTLEDILAEKLRSLLQQPIRNRFRKQDVFDVAYITRQFGATLDRDKIAHFLVLKAAARGVRPTQAAFDDQVKVRASVDYDQLRQATGAAFIPFDTAWTILESLVGELRLPEV